MYKLSSSKDMTVTKTNFFSCNYQYQNQRNKVISRWYNYNFHSLIRKRNVCSTGFLRLIFGVKTKPSMAKSVVFNFSDFLTFRTNRFLKIQC